MAAYRFPPLSEMLAAIPSPEINYLSEQEQRILVKTTYRLNEELAKGNAAASEYIRNLTDAQKAVAAKVAEKSGVAGIAGVLSRLAITQAN